MITKIVESNHYHLWTDALHARSLAHQAKNKWDRGTYVRWAISTSWTVLEMACQDALNENDISRRFKDNLNTAIQKKGLAPLQWGCGIWQRVTALQNSRNSITHQIASKPNLFPDALEADNAIEVVRNAILAIYTHCEIEPPRWIRDNFDRGWNVEKSIRIIAINSPYIKADGAIVVTREIKGKEEEIDYLSPDTDIDQLITDDIEQVLDKFIPPDFGPANAIRFYRGGEVLLEYIFDETKIRGI